MLFHLLPSIKQLLNDRSELVLNIQICWFSYVVPFEVWRNSSVFCGVVFIFLAQRAQTTVQLPIHSNIKVHQGWHVIRLKRRSILLVPALSHIVLSKRLPSAFCLSRSSHWMVGVAGFCKLFFEVLQQLIAILIITSFFKEIFGNEFVKHTFVSDVVIVFWVSSSFF